MLKQVIDGVNFIRLKGNSIERATVHASIMREEILQGVSFYLARKNESLIRKGPGLLEKKFFQEAVVLFYKKLFLPLLSKNIKKEKREIVRVFADEIGIPFEQCLECFFQPDALLFLSRSSLMRYLLSDLPHGGLPGCTSAVALKELTKNKKLLVGRNLDYPVIGPWEKFTTVVFHEPTEKNVIPHVAITTAGLHTSGLTSMNREGITLAVHAHFAKQVSMRGTDVLTIGDEIIARSKSLDEAIDIARGFTPLANWSFIVSSAKENDAIAIEMTPKRTMVCHAEHGMITYSNFFQSPELQKQEGLLSGAYCEDLVARSLRMQQILNQYKGELEPCHMSQALGDQIDPRTGEEKVLGNTVSVVTTVQSAVFEPESQKFWISSRKESPTGLGDFLEVNVDHFWKSKQEGLPKLFGYQPKNPKLKEAIHHYANAYRSWHVEEKKPQWAYQTLESLEKAIACYPQDGNLFVQAGIFAFKQRLFKKAFSFLSKALSKNISTHVMQVSHLFLARCHDILGQREEAQAIYSLYQKVNDPKLKAAYRKGMKRRFHQKEISQILIDLQFADVFRY